MPPARSSLHPLAAALLLAIGDAGASGFIPVNIGGDAHVPGRCTLREAIVAANTHATPAGTDCVAGSSGGNTIAIPPALSPIELTGGVLDIADSGGETRIQSTVSGTRVAVRRVSGSGSVFSANQPAVFEDLAISGGLGDMAGGGVAGGSTTVTLRRCHVHGNTSQYFSGGVTIGQGGVLVVIDSTVVDNHSSEYGNGGGIGVNLGTLVLDGSTVSGNSSPIGGGIFAWQGALALHNSTVSGNTADQGGGIGVYAPDSFETNHVTVSGNAAPQGAGVRLYSRPALGSEIVAQNSLFAGNAGSPDIEHLGGADDTLVGGNNLIGQISEHVAFPPDTLRCDPRLRPLADNGGPTWTHALPEGSCAIDAGGPIVFFDHDQRGEGHPREFGPAVDIGAYERDPDEVDQDRVFADGFD